jgi:predicted DNA-binding transcriptional regulator AlpA
METFQQPFSGKTVTIGDGPLDLVGTHEIEERHGIDRMQVFRLLGAGDFPEPVATLKVGRVWYAADVDVAVKRLRQAGRLNRAGGLVPWRFLTPDE